MRSIKTGSVVLATLFAMLPVGAQSWIVPIREVADEALKEASQARYDASGAAVAYNPRVLSAVPLAVGAFLRGHEYAHLYLRHMACADTKAAVERPSDLSEDLEREADAFAARLLAESDPAAAEAVAAFFAKAKGPDRPTWLHGLEYDRAAHILATVKGVCAGAVGPAEEPGRRAKFLPFTGRESDPEAAKCLSLAYGEKPSANWNRSEGGAVVELRLPYKNTGARPIRCEMLVASGTMSEPDDDNEYPNWLPYDVRKVIFTLAAGEKRVLTQRLRWQGKRGEHALPALRFAKPQTLGADAALVKCTFADEQLSRAATAEALAAR